MTPDERKELEAEIDRATCRACRDCVPLSGTIHNPGVTFQFCCESKAALVLPIIEAREEKLHAEIANLKAQLAQIKATDIPTFPSNAIEDKRLSELVDWLRNESEELMGHVQSRKSYAQMDEDATESDLKEAKKLAERMAGRKLPLATVSVKEARKNAAIQRRIIAKLEQESRQINRWADILSAALRKESAPEEPKC